MQTTEKDITAALFRQIFETTGDGILITDDEGTIALVNKTLCNMTGFSAEELIGRSGSSLIAGEANPMVDEFYADYHSGLLDIHETFYARKDGSIFPVHLKITEARNLPGLSAGIIICVMDVTLMENARQQLSQAMRDIRKAHDFLENIFNMTGDGIFVTDDLGKIVWANRAFVDMMGYSLHELIGLYPPELSPDIDDDQAVARMAEEMFIKSEGDYYEALYQRKDGTVFPIETKITNLKEDSKQQPAIIVTIRDITERKKLEGEVRKAYEALEEKVNERTMHLEEANTALRVLLRGGNAEKHALESKIASNVNELVFPYLQKIRDGKITDRHQALLEIIESNLKDIISSFSTSARFINMTPTEIKIANLVKAGKSTKEISDLLSLSTRTVEGHRDNIRKKTGLKNKKTNLRTYLLSLE